LRQKAAKYGPEIRKPSSYTLRNSSGRRSRTPLG
jgi:hypothetical protein